MAYKTSKSAVWNSERGIRRKVRDGAKLGPCDGSVADRGRSFVAFWLLGNLHHDFGVAAHEHRSKLEVTVEIGINMSITNPAQLVAE